MDKPRHYHDSLTGLDHRYDQMFSWHCSIHDRRCDPFKPVTAQQIRELAARDKSLGDGAFVALSQALRGDEVTG